MLASSEVDLYRDQGYLVVEDVLTEANVQALRDRADHWVEQSRQVVSSDEVFDLEPGHTPERPQVRRIKNPGSIEGAYEQMMRSSAILDVVESLVGPDIQWHNTKLNMKSAGVGSPVEWHQDWGFYPHTNDDLLAIGVALDDMTLENGCLLVVPGSHKGPVLDHHYNGKFVGAVDPKEIDEAAAVPLQARAGSITVHHVRTLHGSAPNTSGRSRRLYLMSFGAADAWPITGTTWEEYAGRIVRGAPTREPRMEALPVRIPLPIAEHSGSIYELQAEADGRRSQFNVSVAGKS